MPRVAIFIRHAVNSPASYYRLVQFIKDYSSHEVKFFTYSPINLYNFYNNLSLNRYVIRKVMQAILYIIGVFRITWFILYDFFFYHSSTVIVIRRFFPRRMPFWGAYLIKTYLKDRRLYWDFDDNIIIDKEIVKKEAEIMQENSIKISVTSSYLRDTLPAEFHHKVLLLPTTDTAFMNSNIDKLIQYRQKKYDNEIRLVWIGTRGNLKYLRMIMNALDKAAKQCEYIFNKRLYLFVVCNEVLEYSSNHLIIQNVTWSRETAKNILAYSHIGLMPLEDNDYTRGKGAFKAIQYISAAVPAIISNVGFNTQVVETSYNGYLVKTNEEWVQYITSLSSDKQLWLNMSRNARRKWEQSFNSRVNSQYWANVISGLPREENFNISSNRQKR